MIKRPNIIAKYSSLSLPVKAGFWFTVSGFIQKAIAFITMPLFTRLLSSEEYGIVTVFNSWENIFFLLITMNVFYGAFNTAMMDFERERDSYTSSIVGFIVVSGLVWAIIYFFLRSFINSITGMTSLMFFVMFFQIVFQGLFSVWLSRCKFSYEYVPVVVSSVVLFLLSPILSIIGIALFPENRVEAKIIGQASAYFLTGFYAGICILRKDNRLVIPSCWVYAVRLSAPLLLHYIASVVLGQSDRIMIAKFDGESKAAIYAVAYSVSMAFTIITTSTCQAIIPRLYECIKSNDLQIIKDDLHFILGIVVVAISVLMLVGPEVIKIIAPLEYYEASCIIPSVMASIFFFFIFQVFANIEFYYKRIHSIVWTSMFAAIANVVLNYVFIPIYGYRAAAYTTLFCYILYGLFHFLNARYIARNEGLIWPFSSKIIIFSGALLLLLTAFTLIVYDYILLRYVIISISVIYIIAKYKKLSLMVYSLLHYDTSSKASV